MNYLSIENLSKSYGVKELFSQLTFGLNKGQKVALIAQNGTGKSTLLKILAGHEQADEGSFSIRKGIKLAYLEQSPIFSGNQTVMEAVFDSDSTIVQAVKRYEECLLYPERVDELQLSIEQMDKLEAWDYDIKVKQILGQLRVTDLTQKVGLLSGGQQKRVALAKVLSDEPDLLLLDEPTNHLDIEMIQWLEAFLSNSASTLLMITHDRYFLDEVCNEVLEFDGGNWYKYKGGYNYFVQKKMEREEIEAVEVGKAKNLMKKELNWIRRQPKARGTKAKYRVDAFQDIKEKASKKLDQKSVELEVNISRLGSKILELHNVKKNFGDLVILDGFKYTFKRGEKIGIVGKNGSGKSTLLNIIMGMEVLDGGKVVTGDTVVFSYYNQKGIKLPEDKRVIEVVKDIAEVIPLMKGRKITASQMLERFLFDKEEQYTFVSKLSGGERKRLYLLTLLMRNPNFLILDEPTNDLDIMTLNVLEDFLMDFSGCLLVVTHDRFFMDKLVDHLFVFEGDGKIKDHWGTYTEYRVKKQLEESKEKKEAANKVLDKPQKKFDGAPSIKKLTYKEKLEFEQLESEIEKLEEEKEKLNTLLNSGITDHLELEKIAKTFEETNQDLEEKSNRWLELSERV